MSMSVYEFSDLTAKACARFAAGGNNSIQRSSSLTSAELPVACASCLACSAAEIASRELPVLSIKPLPGCDRPSDSLRPVIWSRVFAYATCFGSIAQSWIGPSRQKPRQIIFGVCHYLDQRPAFFLPLLDSLTGATDAGQCRSKVITRVPYYPAEFSRLLCQCSIASSILRCCDRASASP